MARSDFSAIRHFAQGAWDTTVNHVARMWAGDYGNRPVVIVDGDQPPLSKARESRTGLAPETVYITPMPTERLAGGTSPIARLRIAQR